MKPAINVQIYPPHARDSTQIPICLIMLVCNYNCHNTSPTPGQGQNCHSKLLGENDPILLDLKSNLTSWIIMCIVGLLFYL